MDNQTRRLETVLFILILLIGATLRLVALDSVPPGLTHDEADHGMDAAGVLDGRTPIYFTVGYGREPFYDYVTALVMLVVGRSFLASRLTAALFGVGLFVLVYIWVRLWTQNRWLALSAMAGLAVSFWGVSTSRQALRSITLPVVYLAAAIAMRRGIRVEEDVDDDFLPPSHRPQAEIERWTWFALAGVFLGLSIYTYLAARVMWVVFPTFFLFLSLTQPGVIRRAWPGLLIMLTIAALVAAPLAIYLLNNPAAEERIGQLSGPINAFLAGDTGALLRNVRAGLGMITISGDDLWLYNIPGKPLLGPVMSLLFYLGLSIAVMSMINPYHPARRGMRTYDDAFRVSSANAFMLLTLVIGLVPALITGVGASMTRVIGMQPALYYFPALAVVWLADWAHRRVGPSGVTALWTAYGVLILVVTGMTIRDYFGVWANARDVRVAYHTTLVETLHYLDAQPEIGPNVAMSTIYPGRFHDPAVAEMILKREDLRIRWFDGRSSLVIPDNSEYTVIFPEIATPEGTWESQLINHGETYSAVEHIELRPNDFNRVVEIVTVSRSNYQREEDESWLTVGDFLLIWPLYFGVDLPDTVYPGETIQVFQEWWVEQTTETEVVLFTQALNEKEEVVAQQDFLGAPTSSWFQHDTVIQVHYLFIPPDTPSGELHIIIGAYTTPDMIRLNFRHWNGDPVGDHFVIGKVEVIVP